MSYAISLLFLSWAWATPHADKIQQLQSEYRDLKELTKSLEADGMVGNLYYYKKFNGYEILWDKNDYEVDGHDTLRIFKPITASNSDEAPFSVTYIYSNYLLENTATLRRFVGPQRNGWRADTVDLGRDEYKGWQGVQSPRLTEFEKEILENYGIQLFDN